MQTKDQTPLITDQLLAELTAPDHQASMGEWDDETRALLATAIPEMARELLTRRSALTIAIHPAAAAQSLEAARAILRAPDPINSRRLVMACRSIMLHSKDASEYNAAKDVLEQIEAAA